MLATGAKAFFENPAVLIGIPLLALGLLGVLLTFAPLGRRATDGGEGEVWAPELPPLSTALWAGAVGLGLALVVLGVAFHPALIVGGLFLMVAGGVKLAQETMARRGGSSA